MPDVIRYVQNQETHHRKETFLNEYRKMLKLFEVEYDEQYIFKDLAQNVPTERTSKIYKPLLPTNCSYGTGEMIFIAHQNIN